MGRTWARTKWKEFTSAFAVRYLTYLFTWSVVPRGPGRASLDPSALSSGRVVHLGRSLSSIYGFGALAVDHSFHFCQYVVPVLDHTYAEEVSPRIQPAMLHSQVVRIRRAPCSFFFLYWKLFLNIDLDRHQKNEIIRVKGQQAHGNKVFDRKIKCTDWEHSYKC